MAVGNTEHFVDNHGWLLSILLSALARTHRKELAKVLKSPFGLIEGPRTSIP